MPDIPRKQKTTLVVLGSGLCASGFSGTQAHNEGDKGRMQPSRLPSILLSVFQIYNW